MSDLIEQMVIIKQVVSEQAEDESIWFDARYITEDLLQQELRRLHYVIETGQYKAATHLD